MDAINTDLGDEENIKENNEQQQYEKILPPQNDTDAAPSLYSTYCESEIINPKKEYDYFEEEKLLLIRCSFFYDSKKNRNDFYKITFGKNIELNYQRIKQKKNNYDKCINNYHYNFVNLMDYIEEIISQLKNRNKNKINFKLSLKFINNDKNNINNRRKNNNDCYNFDIICNYMFLYNDKKRNIQIKKKYTHNNIFDVLTQLTKINNILNEIEEILNKINLKNKEELIIKEKDDVKINKIKKISKINCSKFNFISFQKKIEEHKNTVQMIKYLPCGNYVSCGFDGQLFLFDENLNYLNKIEIIGDWIYSISEIPDTTNEFMACCPGKIFLLSINDNKMNLENKLLNTNSLNLFTFSTKDDEIIFCGNKAISKYNGKIKEIKPTNTNNIFVLKEFRATCGKKISDNIILVVSNKIYKKFGNKNGDDKLVYYNIKNEITQEEYSYSFNTSPNSLLLIDTNIIIENSIDDQKKKKKKKKKKNNLSNNDSAIKNKEEKVKLLFCACTKYESDQKNGILILCPNNIEIEDNFYDTKDFEVFCFCLLKSDINDKNYLLVGGYDNTLNHGLIKLYDIIYDTDKKIELTKIKFNRNIYNLSRFKEPINCIIQSPKTGEIIVTCWDGSINLFSKPNYENL